MCRYGSWLVGLVTIGLIAIGCPAPRVATSLRESADFARYDSAHILPVVVDEASAPSLTDIPAQIEEMARQRISARGYRVASRDEVDFTIQVALAVETVQRQTWDSDPDASALVVREFEEAVLRLRAIDPVSEQEVWLAETRSRLPERDLLLGPRPEGIWRRALIAAVEQLPRGSDPTVAQLPRGSD